MSKFKVGDRVEIIGDHPNKGCVTTIESLHLDSWIAPWVGVKGGLTYRGANAPALNQIKLLEKTMDNLQIGDILVKEYEYCNNTEHKVLAVIGDVVIIDDSDDDTSTDTLIISKLEKDGYSLKDAEPEVKEMTVDEVSKLVGKTVKIVK